MTVGPSPRTTLRDVADRAGVSIATASKALNGKPGVSAATRAEVVRTARELGFRPNELARSLFTGSSRSIGLLANETGWRFSRPVLAGIEAHGEQDMSVLLCDGRGDVIRERHHLRTLQDRQVDGIVVVGHKTNPRRSISADVSVPVIYAYTPSDDPADTSFVPDDEGGARLATRHLISSGRRRLAYIGGDPAWLASAVRAEGFQATLREAGLQEVAPSVHGSWTQRWGRYAAHMLLESGSEVDGIFCGSDVVATGVLDVLRDRGVRVPDDVAVVGFDNWTAFAEESRPPMTSVDMNLEALGSSAGAALVQALSGHTEPGVHLQPCRLVVRESSAG